MVDRATVVKLPNLEMQFIRLLDLPQIPMGGPMMFQVAVDFMHSGTVGKCHWRFVEELRGPAGDDEGSS
jgi:hypothetical protein